MSLESESVMTVERSSTTDERQETTGEKIEQLRQERDRLVRRLLDGEGKIRDDIDNGAPLDIVRKAENRWINLLHDYERICDGLDEMEGPDI